MKTVLIMFPTAWDRRQLPACKTAWEERYQLIWAEPSDEDCPWDLDIVPYVEEQIRARAGRIDGVLSSSDYPGATVAGAIATALGLPGSPPETVIRCSHKYYSRIAQREAAPDAVPEFRLVDPRSPGSWDDVPFPCYIKPVKGAFSIMTRRLERKEELKAFLKRPAVREFLEDYVFIFNRLVKHFTRLEVDGRFFLAEGLLKGQLVTVEGFCHRGSVEVLGFVDSVVHPETGSFVRFEYPSALATGVKERLAELTRRVMWHLGLQDSLFNIEWIYDPASDQVGIIEINPRLCGEFADLYQKVDGVSGYEVALALATGERPVLRDRAGPFTCAASFPLRVFEPVRVVHAPEAACIADVEARFPGTLVWTECETGQELQDFETAEDGASARYGIVNAGASSRDELFETFTQIQRALDYRFSPL